MKKVMNERNLLLYFVGTYTAALSRTSIRRRPTMIPATKGGWQRSATSWRSATKELFILHQELSLDETLILAFGRIKFNVPIVTKAARYGIKIYVITDAATVSVLRMVFYTGMSTYYGCMPRLILWL
jgi:Transposase IS4